MGHLDTVALCTTHLGTWPNWNFLPFISLLCYLCFVFIRWVAGVWGDGVYPCFCYTFSSPKLSCLLGGFDLTEWVVRSCCVIFPIEMVFRINFNECQKIESVHFNFPSVLRLTLWTRLRRHLFYAAKHGLGKALSFCSCLLRCDIFPVMQ